MSTEHKARPASVIVATRNRLGELGRCLEAIASLAYPQVEAVVVNDGGEPVEAVTGRFSDRLQLEVVKTAGAGPAAARNAGAEAAAGQLLAFTDDDCEPERGWLRALAGAIGDGDEVLAGGRTVNALEHNRYSRTSQAIQDAAYSHYNVDPKAARFFASNNVAMAASRFADLGGFDPALRTSEDRDLCHRWIESGGRLAYVPEAVVRHSHVLGLRGFWRQHYGYGRGAYRHRRLRSRRGGSVEPPAATSGVLSSAARSAMDQRDFGRLGLLGVWQLATFAGAAREALSRAPR